MIAAVLLIAFTMAVASIFAQWAPQLMKNAQGDTSKKANQIQDCSDITMQVVDGSAANATVQQKTGDKAVGYITVTWFYKNAGPAQAHDWINNTRGSKRVTGGTSGNTLDHIEVDPVQCEGAATTTYTP